MTLCPLPRPWGSFSAALGVWLTALVAGAEGAGPPDGTVRTAGSLSGRVVDAERRPLAGARVRLYRDDVDARPRRWVTAREAVTTDAAGRYAFADLPEGWYVVVAERDGSAKAFRYAGLEEGQELTHDVVLRKPVSSDVLVRDENGRPVAGARFRTLEPRGENSEFWFRSRSDWETFGMAVPPSDADGRLRLPELPEGSVVRAVIDHPDFAPAEVKDVAVRPGVAGAAVVKPGVTVALRIAPGEDGAAIREAEIDFRHDPFSHPSTVILHRLPVDDLGVARVTVEPGRYSLLRLTHEDFFVLPEYSPRVTDGKYLRIGDSANEEFHFRLFPKVTVRGRVVDASGRPLAKMFVLGQVPNGDVRQAAEGARTEEAPDDWAYVDWAETDEKGEYALKLTSGPARVSFGGQDYVGRDGHLEFVVAADGSTAAPDLVLHPMPKVTGTVFGPDGTPAAGAVVRFRGGLRFMQPTKTDDRGRFELSPSWVPIDPETSEPQPAQPLVAFHAYERLGARATVDLGDPDSLKDLTLTLGPQEPGAFLDGYREESTPAERGEVAEDRLAERAARSLIGQPAPPLDGTWLNIEEPSEGLAAFRGKYVLLDFWSLGCGPCHADFPSVALLHELYEDRGLVVISVHDNSATAEAVRQFAEKEGMHVPIVVDEPDGRTVARYEGRGLEGYPSHLLIGPDGTVIDDDRTTPGPSLRTYKIELIRERLLGGTVE